MVTRPAHYNTRYKFDLSPRQREVLDLIARGRTNPEIADALGVSLDGAKYHVREILAKLDVESREEAVMFWRSQPPDGKAGARLSGSSGSAC
jgi:DNA-binding CsgD family transcriptional regulator